MKDLDKVNFEIGSPMLDNPKSAYLNRNIFSVRTVNKKLSTSNFRKACEPGSRDSYIDF